MQFPVRCEYYIVAVKDELPRNFGIHPPVIRDDNPGSPWSGRDRIGVDLIGEGDDHLAGKRDILLAVRGIDTDNAGEGDSDNPDTTRPGGYRHVVMIDIELVSRTGQIGVENHLRLERIRYIDHLEKGLDEITFLINQVGRGQSQASHHLHVIGPPGAEVGPFRVEIESTNDKGAFRVADVDYCQTRILGGKLTAGQTGDQGQVSRDFHPVGHTEGVDRTHFGKIRVADINDTESLYTGCYVGITSFYSDTVSRAGEEPFSHLLRLGGFREIDRLQTGVPGRHQGQFSGNFDIVDVVQGKVEGAQERGTEYVSSVNDLEVG